MFALFFFERYEMKYDSSDCYDFEKGEREREEAVYLFVFSSTFYLISRSSCLSVLSLYLIVLIAEQKSF